MIFQSKLRKILVALTVGIVMLIAIAGQALAATGTIIDKVNMRAAPVVASGNIRAELMKNEQVTINSETAIWSNVKYPTWSDVKYDATGWVSKSCVTRSGSTLTVNPGDVNLRVSPGTSTTDTVKALIKAGQTLTYLGESGNWYKAKYSRSGFIARSYINIPPPVTSSTFNYQKYPDLVKAVTNVHKAYGIDPIVTSTGYSVGWGVYDLSGSQLKTVASFYDTQDFQTNCTIKAVLLLYLCKLNDEGTFAFTDANKTLMNAMISISDNNAFWTLLKKVKVENFNAFLKNDLKSGTQLPVDYSWMGQSTTQNRAKEWFWIYKYCHGIKIPGSTAEIKKDNAKYAWNLLRDAGSSYIGYPNTVFTVAHKSGWYTPSDKGATAGDCAVVRNKDGGCYLMIIFTKKRALPNDKAIQRELIKDLAYTLDDIWDIYNYVDASGIGSLTSFDII